MTTHTTPAAPTSTMTPDELYLMDAAAVQAQLTA